VKTTTGNNRWSQPLRESGAAGSRTCDIRAQVYRPNDYATEPHKRPRILFLPKISKIGQRYSHRQIKKGAFFLNHSVYTSTYNCVCWGYTGPTKKFDDIFSRLDSMHERDRQTDGRTDTGPQQRPHLRIASRGKND